MKFSYQPFWDFEKNEIFYYVINGPLLHKTIINVHRCQNEIGCSQITQKYCNGMPSWRDKMGHDAVSTDRNEGWNTVAAPLIAAASDQKIFSGQLATAST